MDAPEALWSGSIFSDSGGLTFKLRVCLCVSGKRSRCAWTTSTSDEAHRGHMTLCRCAASIEGRRRSRRRVGFTVSPPCFVSGELSDHRGSQRATFFILERKLKCIAVILCHLAVIFLTHWWVKKKIGFEVRFSVIHSLLPLRSFHRKTSFSRNWFQMISFSHLLVWTCNVVECCRIKFCPLEQINW